MVASVLVVEDDNDLAGLIVDALRREGYAADMVENGANAISQVAERPPDAVILDLRLPDMDGLDVCAHVRGRGYEGGIIIVTARSEADDIERSATAGANDFLAKPFGLAELIVCVREVMRGSGRWSTPHQHPRGSAGLVLDMTMRRAHAGPFELGLTDREFDILAVLADRRSEPVTAEALLDHVWGGTGPGAEKALRMTLRQLRRRLAATSADRAIVEDRTGFRLSPHAVGEQEVPRGGSHASPTRLR